MAKENSKPQPDPLVILAATDSSAFILLYDIYYEKIYRYCAGRLHSKQVIEDLTSMIFIRAARNISRFTGRTRTEFFDWLYAIATEEVDHCLKKGDFAKLANKTEQSAVRLGTPNGGRPTAEPIETPDAGHKEKLRAKILSVFNIGRAEISRLFFYNIVAAAVLVIAAFLVFQFASAKRHSLPKKIATPVRTQPNETNLPKKVKPITLIPAPSKEANTAQPAVVEEKPKTISNTAASEETNEPLTIKIGGIVKNQHSEPIKAAAVRVLVEFSDNEGKQNISLLGTFKTDANGFWQCSNFPLNATNISIMATHPDYLPAENYRMGSLEQLEDSSSVTILEKGITVTGRVVDWEQKPLQATITKGSLPSDTHNAITCDANGWFHFDNVTEGVEVFIARYGDGAPQMQPVEIKPDMPPVIFTIEPPNHIRGKIVDINGTPVKDALAAVSSWQGTNSLNFETKTDADGFFQWTNAPADEVSFDIQKNNYMSVRNYVMKSGSDYVITLRPAFKFGGIVTSEVNDMPVKTFKITLGFYYIGTNISWQETAASFSNNKFELLITEPLDFQLRAQADGFESVDSPVFNPSQNAAEYNFILVPTKTTP